MATAMKVDVSDIWIQFGLVSIGIENPPKNVDIVAHCLEEYIILKDIFKSMNQIGRNVMFKNHTILISFKSFVNSLSIGKTRTSSSIERTNNEASASLIDEFQNFYSDGKWVPMLESLARIVKDSNFQYFLTTSIERNCFNIFKRFNVSSTACALYVQPIGVFSFNNMDITKHYNLYDRFQSWMRGNLNPIVDPSYNVPTPSSKVTFLTMRYLPLVPSSYELSSQQIESWRMLNNVSVSNGAPSTPGPSKRFLTVEFVSTDVNFVGFTSYVDNIPLSSQIYQLSDARKQVLNGRMKPYRSIMNDYLAFSKKSCISLVDLLHPFGSMPYGPFIFTDSDLSIIEDTKSVTTKRTNIRSDRSDKISIWRSQSETLFGGSSFLGNMHDDCSQFIILDHVRRSAREMSDKLHWGDLEIASFIGEAFESDVPIFLSSIYSIDPKLMDEIDKQISRSSGTFVDVELSTPKQLETSDFLNWSSIGSSREDTISNASLDSLSFLGQTGLSDLMYDILNSSQNNSSDSILSNFVKEYRHLDGVMKKDPHLFIDELNSSREAALKKLVSAIQDENIRRREDVISSQSLRYEIITALNASLKIILSANRQNLLGAIGMPYLALKYTTKIKMNLEFVGNVRYAFGLCNSRSKMNIPTMFFSTERFVDNDRGFGIYKPYVWLKIPSASQSSRNAPLENVIVEVRVKHGKDKKVVRRFSQHEIDTLGSIYFESGGKSTSSLFVDCGLVFSNYKNRWSSKETRNIDDFQAKWGGEYVAAISTDENLNDLDEEVIPSSSRMDVDVVATGKKRARTSESTGVTTTTKKPSLQSSTTSSIMNSLYYRTKDVIGFFSPTEEKNYLVFNECFGSDRMVPVYGYTYVGDDLYCATSALYGDKFVTLSSYFENTSIFGDRRLGILQILSIITDVAGALAYSEYRGCVHTNISTDSIMITPFMGGIIGKCYNIAGEGSVVNIDELPAGLRLYYQQYANDRDDKLPPGFIKLGGDLQSFLFAFLIDDLLKKFPKDSALESPNNSGNFLLLPKRVRNDFLFKSATGAVTSDGIRNTIVKFLKRCSRNLLDKEWVESPMMNCFIFLSFVRLWSFAND